MAAKLILSMDGAVLQECQLDKERVTIGRKAHNDIVINNLAVSGVHAAIITILHDSFLEDLESTNGLTVNGEPTKKHFLQNNDVIEIGKYTLKYVSDRTTQTTATDFEKTMMMRAPVSTAPQVSEKFGDTGHFRLVQGELTAGTARINLSAPEYAVPAAHAPITPAPIAPAPIAPAPIAAAPIAAAPIAAAATPAQTLAAVQILNGPNAGKGLDLVKSLTTLGKPGVQVAVLTRRPHGYFITHVEGAVFPLVNGQMLGEQPHQLKDHDVIELAGVKMEFYFKG